MQKYFWIKRPNKTQRRFSLLCQEKGEKARVIPSPELDKLNELYRAQALTFEEATLRAKEIAHALRARPASSRENRVVLAGFLKGRRPVVDEGSRRAKYERALIRIGGCSLLSSTQAELQSSLHNLPANKQRESASKLNELMRYLKRDVRLWLLPQDHKRHTYLSVEEGLLLIKQLPPRLGLLVGALFSCGCRFGEAFAIRSEDVRSDWIYLKYQITKQGKEKLRKNKKESRTATLRLFHPFLTEWAALPLEEKMTLRHLKPSEALPLVGGRRIKFHTFRHSYAKVFLSVGNSLTELARALGDSMSTTEKHYADWQLDVGELKNIKRG